MTITGHLNDAVTNQEINLKEFTNIIVTQLSHQICELNPHH